MADIVVFGFPEPESSHTSHVLAEYGDVLGLLARISLDVNEGFGLLGRLPGIEQRNKATLMAALFTRSFKSLTCAIDLAVRGYYVQAIMLIRHTWEDRWLQWELDQDPDGVDRFLDREKPNRFIEMTREIDKWLVRSNLGPAEEGFYRQVYADFLSEIAHPRYKALRMEFDKTLTRLETGPEWDSEYCLATLGSALIAADNVLGRLRMFLRFTPAAGAWLTRSDQTCKAADAWMKATTTRFQQATQKGEPPRA